MHAADGDAAVQPQADAVGRLLAVVRPARGRSGGPVFVFAESCLDESPDGQSPIAKGLDRRRPPIGTPAASGHRPPRRPPVGVLRRCPPPKKKQGAALGHDVGRAADGAVQAHRAGLGSKVGGFFVVVAYIVMAYIVMALCSCGCVPRAAVGTGRWRPSSRNGSSGPKLGRRQPAHFLVGITLQVVMAR